MSAARNNRRRKKSRGRLGPLFQLLWILAVGVALTMGATVFFQVEAVLVVGNSRYTQEEVAAATGIAIGDNLFRMNKYQIARQLQQELPYIEEVSIRRNLPSTLLVTVTEWSAVARVEVPVAGSTQSVTEPVPPPEEQEEGDAPAQPLAVAQEPWLISVGGKLLEPATQEGAYISVTGITPLVPRAGTALSLPQEERSKLNALLGVLRAMQEQDVIAQVSALALEATQVRLQYLNRFTVKLPINGDFTYQLRVLKEAVADLDHRVGPECTGTLDMTQEGYQAVYSP